MITKFKLFENIDPNDPYNEERWVENTIPYIPYEDQNFDEWLLEVGVSEEEKKSLFDIHRRIMSKDDKTVRAKILFDEFMPLIKQIADNLDLYGDDKENFMGAILMGNNFSK